MSNALALLDQDQNLKTLTQLALINMKPGSSKEDALLLVVKEKTNIELIMSTRPELSECSGNSIIQAIKQCINDNLTLSPSAGLVWLYPRNIQVGVDKKTNAKIYENVVVYDPTANGRLSIARQSGTILDHKRPYCVYDSTGKVEKVVFEILVPSYPHPRWEALEYGAAYFERWKKAAINKSSSKTTPALYTSWNGGIDPEFAGSKAIRHGLNKRGTNMNEKRYSAPMHFSEQFIDPNVALNEASEENSDAPTSYKLISNPDELDKFKANIVKMEDQENGFQTFIDPKLGNPININEINPNDL